MKKLVSVLLVLILCLCACALAEDGFWTRSDDFYYHYNSLCGGEDARVPISAEAGAAFGKGACPVCLQYKDAARSPQAAFRGGTIAVKFSDAWLKEQELSGVFGFMGEERYAGAEAHRLLRTLLHGEDYNSFLAAWTASGSAEGRVNAPYILPSDGTLVMSRRHIGPDWYIIVRPDEKFGDAWEMYWRVSSSALRMEQDTLFTEFDLQTVEDHYSLQLGSLNSAQPVFTRSSGGIAIEVYHALEGSIAVIREEKPGKNPIENVQLLISGRNDGVELTGYMDAGAAIYCCMLTEAELEALRGNARLELRRTETVHEGDLYRADAGDSYIYYSKSTDEALFSVNKLNGLDPVDDDFRMIYSGMPACFALHSADGGAICDYEGVQLELTASGMRAERVTPLAWSGHRGVFLAEHDLDHDYKGGEAIITSGVEFGREYALSAEKDAGRRFCWLADERGNVLAQYGSYSSAALMEDGSIALRRPDGEIVICDYLTEADG